MNSYLFVISFTTMVMLPTFVFFGKTRLSWKRNTKEHLVNKQLFSMNTCFIELKTNYQWKDE